MNLLTQIICFINAVNIILESILMIVKDEFIITFQDSIKLKLKETETNLTFLKKKKKKKVIKPQLLKMMMGLYPDFQLEYILVTKKSASLLIFF